MAVPLREVGVDEGVDELWARCCAGRDGEVGVDCATGVVSAGLLATGAALWQAAVESRVAIPINAKDAFFIILFVFSRI
jgi:hypothetical protein